MSKAESNDDNSSTGFDITTNSVDEYELSDNVAEDIVRYTRSNIIRNEQQAYILTLGWSTGWMADEENYMNIVTIGTPSGGKTKTNRTMVGLMPTNSYYSTTDVSEAGIYNDADRWNARKFGWFSEWNKLSNPIKEVVKSLAGDDGGADRTKSVQDDEGDWGSGEQSLDSKPYSFTYAQHSLDNEISDRLFFNYIDENIEINRAVTRKHGGHSNITLDTGENEYIFEANDVELALKRHFREMPEDTRVHLPEYMYHAYSPCLDHKRSDVKRTGAMLPNMIRASALQNYHTRPTITEDVDGQSVEKIVAQPQDLCNVLSCRKVLLGTTHGFEPRKRGIVNAVRANTEMSDWCSLQDIQEWLNANAAEVSRLKKNSLRDILRELEEDFIIEVSERHFDSGAHAYAFLSLSDVGHPKVTGFNRSAIEYDSENPLQGVDDPDDPFKDCVNPISGQSFKEYTEDFRDSLRTSVSASASTAMQGSEDDDSEPQSTLDGDTTESMDVDLTSVESVVYDRTMQHADGRTFENDVAHEDVLGLKNDDGGLRDEDTILDPDHDAWQPNDGVSSVSDANRGVEDALESLMAEGVVTFVQTDDGVGRIDVQEVNEDE